MMKHMLAASLLLAFAGSGAALADDDCDVPMSQWQPRDAVQKMADARGWEVSRIKIDDGCYAIRGTDANGQAFKAKIDPATLEVVKMKRKDHDDDDDDDHRSERRQPAGSGTVNPASPSAPPANGLFNGGEPPKATVN